MAHLGWAGTTVSLFFPSVAVAWRLSEEPFMKQFSNLDNLKIRASYGLSGNQDIALYQTWPLMKQQNVILTGTHK